MLVFICGARHHRRLCRLDVAPIIYPTGRAADGRSDLLLRRANSILFSNKCYFPVRPAAWCRGRNLHFKRHIRGVLDDFSAVTHSERPQPSEAATQQEKDGGACEGQDAIKVDSKAESVNRSCRWPL